MHSRMTHITTLHTFQLHKMPWNNHMHSFPFAVCKAWHPCWHLFTVDWTGCYRSETSFEGCFESYRKHHEDPPVQPSPCVHKDPHGESPWHRAWKDVWKYWRSNSFESKTEYEGATLGHIWGDSHLGRPSYQTFSLWNPQRVFPKSRFDAARFQTSTHQLSHCRDAPTRLRGPCIWDCLYLLSSYRRRCPTSRREAGGRDQNRKFSNHLECRSRYCPVSNLDKRCCNTAKVSN